MPLQGYWSGEANALPVQQSVVQEHLYSYHWYRVSICISVLIHCNHNQLCSYTSRAFIWSVGWRPKEHAEDRDLHSARIAAWLGNDAMYLTGSEVRRCFDEGSA